MGVLLAASMASATMAQNAAQHFDIQGQDLAQALKTYAMQANAQLIFSDTVGSGVRTATIKGDFPADQVLRQLLDGTAFTFVRLPTGAIRVYRRQNDNPESLLVRTAAARVVALQAGSAVVAAPPVAPQSVAIEEVVVTANKRAENVQDVPKQVQVVGVEALKTANITSVTDLRKLVPSISGTGNSIRGVATSATTISANSKVGTVLDDIPIPSRATGVNNLLDIEQVEVLAGPQGTLAGRNATGGLINLVTRKPSRDSYTGLAQATVTSDREYIVGAYISGPISDNLAFSLSSNYQRFQGLKYNIRDGQWASNENEGLRAKLLWSIDDNSSLTGTYSYYKEHSKGATNRGPVIAYIGVPLTSITSSLDIRNPKRNFNDLFPGLAEHIGPDSNAYYSAFTERQHRISQTGILRYERDFAAGTFTAIASYLKELAPQLQDTNTYTLVDMNIRPEYDGYAHVGNATDYKTFEARFASTGDGPLTYLVGAFFSDNENIYDYRRLYQPVNWHRAFGQTNGAAFGSVSYELPTATTLRGGMRYEKDYIDYIWEFYPIGPISKVSENGTVLNFPLQNNYRISRNSAEKDFVNYDLGIQQKLGEDVMAYVTYAVADQGPIYDAEDNTVAIVRDLKPVESEQVKSIEGGIKSQFFDRRLTLNVNAFSSTYDNYQASTNVPDPDNPNSIPVLKLNSVGRVTTKGVELTSSWQFDNGFRLNVAGLYNEAKIEKWLNAPCYQLQSAAFGCITKVVPGEVIARPVQPDLSGRTLASAPKLKLTVIPSYTRDLGFWDTSVKFTSIIRYASKQNTNLLGDPGKDVPATTFIDLNVGFTRGNNELQLFVNNVTEETAETFSQQLQPGISNFARLSDGTYRVKIRDLDRSNNRYFGVTLKSRF
jgi:iron complex outermembrane receptor protein